MKNLKFVLTLSFLFLFIGGVLANPPKTDTVKIKTSAVCDMCKDTIEKALAYEKGVKKSTLDVPSKVVTVVYDTKKTNPEKIKKAITEVGYSADEIPADKAAFERLHPCCRPDSH